MVVMNELIGQCSEAAPSHHLLELGEIDHTIAIDIDPHYHLPAVLSTLPLLEAERRQHGFQLVDTDKSIPVLIENIERLLHVFLLVALGHYGLVQRAELVDVDAAVSVNVDLIDHLTQLLVRDEDSHVLQRIVQLLLADRSVPIPVEHLENPLELVGIHSTRNAGQRRRRDDRGGQGRRGLFLNLLLLLWVWVPRRGDVGPQLLGNQVGKNKVVDKENPQQDGWHCRWI